MIVADTPFAKEILNEYRRARFVASDLAVDLTSTILGPCLNTQLGRLCLWHEETRTFKKPGDSAVQLVADYREHIAGKCATGLTNALSVLDSFSTM